MSRRFYLPDLRHWLACACALLSFVLIAGVDAQAQADLAVTKTVNNATPNVGDQITFTITVTNNGPNTATNVSGTDLLPAGLTFVSAIPSQGAYDSVGGLWTVGTVANGASVTLTITATVASSGARTNTVTVTATEADPTLPNTASVTETPQQADLAVTKTVSNATPNVGDQITFTITVTNNGPNAATNVAGTDILPPGLTFVSAAPSQGTYDGISGVWTVGTVASGASVTLSITVTVVSNLAQTNTVINTHADQFDPNTGNNMASATETPQQADLAVTKTVSNATPNVGDQITFTITVTNNGPDAATNVTGNDLLPAGLTFVSAIPSQGTYDSVAGLWTLGAVASGTPVTLTITATVVSPGARTNTVNVAHADQFDPNTGNNTASATETTQQANLAVTKTVDNASPTVGGTITFTITLTNSGPDSATGVTATDLLPAGLTFVSANPSQGTYDSVAGLWTLGAVASGTPVTLTITATVASSGAKTNTVTVTHADQFDPNTTNNTAAVTVTPLAVVPVPTLPTGGLIFLMGTLAALAAWSLHLRRGAGRQPTD